MSIYRRANIVLVSLFVFFFQAEDGIRDHCVTGVQTCALPISTTQPPPQPAEAALTIQGFAFSPNPLNIHPGTKVTATNKDGTNHTWTSDTGAWNSGSLSQNQSFSFTFNQAGTFTYHCSIHASMTGTVNVS